MVSEIISNVGLDNDFESGWFPLSFSRNEIFGKARLAASLQIIWKDVSGTLNGVITIYVSNDLECKTVAGSYTIDSHDNSSDAIMIMIYPSFKYINLAVAHNLIDEGKITALLTYE